MPVKVSAAGAKYGVLLGDKNYNYQLADKLTVVSPAGNLMVKAYSISKKLGLSYGYDSVAKKLTLKNPYNGKSLVFTLGRRSYTYYSGKAAEGSVKTAVYKFYYDSTSKSNVIHMSTLKDIVDYNYYNNLAGTYYSDMGYNALIAYSINDYSSYDIPVTDQLMNYINAKTFKTKEELLDAVRMNLIARRTGVTLKTNRGVMEDIGSPESIYDLVIALDRKNTAQDADYLSLLMDQFQQIWQVYSTGIYSPDDDAELTINAGYESTIAQERIVNSKVPDIIKNLKLTNASDYQKVKKIHDYIINLASYDTTLQKSTTYDILVNKTAVCEGYALAAYRLFTDAGLECRIITGKGNGEGHAWNIVKVDGEWYNIDLTWDDPITNTGKQVLRYDYFLKNDSDFTDHIRDLQFQTEEFMDAYPIAEESYPI
jgi:hypothetical protein